MAAVLWIFQNKHLAGNIGQNLNACLPVRQWMSEQDVALSEVVLLVHLRSLYLELYVRAPPIEYLILPLFQQQLPERFQPAGS